MSGSGRGEVRVEDHQSWVFNRMVEPYRSRPAYPESILDALDELSQDPRTSDRRAARVLDIGAGIGHLALPLAARGHAVTALEPARLMLSQLKSDATAQGLDVTTLHAAAESIPVPAGSSDLVLISDALHFLNMKLASEQMARVLAPRSALALVTVEFAPTPFMDAVQALMHEAAPRRARKVSGAVQQIAGITRVKLAPARQFPSDIKMDDDMIERILGSISFIGPAMNEERYRAFRERFLALPHERIWSRTITLYAGRRSK